MRWSILLLALPLFGQTNPFFEKWDTPFGVPPFDRIKDEHFLPALQRGIDEQRKEVQAVWPNSAPATFANTIEALDARGQASSTRVQGVFYNLTGAETNDRLQQIAREIAPQLSALQDDMVLDARLFARVKQVWERRESLRLNPEQRKLLEETYKMFVRGGANLPDEGKKRLRAMNSELSVLGVRFANNLLKETNAWRLVIDKEKDLAGLPKTSIAAAAEAAKAAGLAGKWVFTLQAPSIWPFLSYAENRDLRRQILEAYIRRCARSNDEDNREILAKVATLRAERARVLGYPTHAHFALEERMAKEPAKVYALLEAALEARPAPSPPAKPATSRR